MHVTSLKLTNVRSIESATLRFQPGFNLVVGVNGVGKTTVLSALACALSHLVRQVNGLKVAAREPSSADLRFGSDALTVECAVSIDDSPHTFLVFDPVSVAAVALDGEGKPREQTHAVSARREFLGAAPQEVAPAPPRGRALAVLFSTRRAAAARSEARQRRAAGGVTAAFVDALDEREFGLVELADWMRAQAALASERPQAQRLLDALEAATRRFLPGYRNLRPVEDVAAAQRSAARAAAAAAGAAAAAAAASVTGDPAAASQAALRTAHLAAQAAGHASRTSLLMIDRGEVEVVPVHSLPDSERALVRHAIERAEAWLALNWTGSEAREGAGAGELDADRRRVRADRVEKELAVLLPSCGRLQDDPVGGADSMIERLPTSVPVTQLSDGERGTLAMVLDLTRRLAQANPHLADPAAEAEAVVLIDEIDLHLHPGWQREVVRSLTSVFPRCQFIATTHSPQVISEVPHDRIQIMDPRARPDGVYRPGHSFGVDSSRILEELMDVSPRPVTIQERFKRISGLARPETLAEAHRELSDLASRMGLGESDPDVVRLRTLLEFVGDD